MTKKRKAKRETQQENVDAGKGDGVEPAIATDVKGGTKGDRKVSAKHHDNDSTSEAYAEADHFTIPFNDKSIPCERRRATGKRSLIFTHGAGGGLAAPASKEFAEGCAEKAGIVSFKGAMNLQSRIKTFNAVADHEDFDAALGGRSMGARAAAITAIGDERNTKALVLVSFPLVGAKNKDSREQILLDLPEHIDVLFVVGSKDSMCDSEQLRDVCTRMKGRTWHIVVEGADHGMDWKPKASAQEMRRLTGRLAAEWLDKHDSKKRHRVIRWDEDSGQVDCGSWAENEERSQEAGEQEKPPSKKRKTK